MMMNKDEHSTFLEVQRRKLEDSFFLEQDKVLIQQLKSMKKMQETKKALAVVSGIHTDAVLEKLVELEIRPETLATLTLVPLLEVAWADGSVSPEEEKVLLAAAAKAGIAQEGAPYELLKQWLHHRPSSKLLDAWVHYIGALCEKLTKKETTALKGELLSAAEKVANASGGVLGLGAVSKEEKKVLAVLAKAFEKK